MFYRTAKQQIRGFAHCSQTSPRSGSVQMGQSPTGNVVRRPGVRIERCQTIESAVVWHSDRKVPARAHDSRHQPQELDRICDVLENLKCDDQIVLQRCVKILQKRIQHFVAFARGLFPSVFVELDAMGLQTGCPCLSRKAPSPQPTSSIVLTGNDRTHRRVRANSGRSSE